MKIVKLYTVIICLLLSSCSIEEPEGTVEITDIVIGTGAEATNGKTITVHYVGTLTNGSKFDSSRDRLTPYTFVLGARQVIQGWEEGIPGMKVGGKRKLVISPAFGYGSRAQSGIPANSTLIFEVELLSVK
ncbi:MAG: FKBP-type peptidyl-prolyl cis-trans isomerase [Ignavibacteria bacterium]|nr:FKBP-type peptidyl-prolyl cis-trans isomerase [Ignavibacteria bacterium]